MDASFPILAAALAVATALALAVGLRLASPARRQSAIFHAGLLAVVVMAAADRWLSRARPPAEAADSVGV